jgi:hypothetical protein
VSFKTLDSVRPKAEGFLAKCHLVIKTGEHETYRFSPSKLRNLAKPLEKVLRHLVV